MAVYWIELTLYAILILLQVPTCNNLAYLKNFTILVSAIQPAFSVWYLTKFHIVRNKPLLYQEFRVKQFPVSSAILTLVANSWPDGHPPQEFLVSGLLAVMSVGLCKEFTKHVEHTLHVLATNMALILLIAPSLGLFTFLFLTTCLVTIVLYDVQKCFSVSEYVLGVTFLSYVVYKAIFDTSSLFVLLCMISIAVFLALPPLLDRDTILILLALCAWITVIFSKNATYHLSRIDMVIKETSNDLKQHQTLVFCWGFSTFLAVTFTVFPITGLNLHVQRKLYHLFIVLVFVSGICIAPRLLSTASLCVTFVMFFCEVLYYRGALSLRKHLANFRGSQDVDPLVLTPLCLLLGLSVPVWARYGTFSEGPLHPTTSTTFLQAVLPYTGVMTVGVGDACAAIIGTSFGRVRLPHTHKTVEGLLGNIAGQALFMVLIGPYLRWGARSTSDALVLGSAMIGSSLLEVYTKDIDNLIVPIYTMLCLTVF